MPESQEDGTQAVQGLQRIWSSRGAACALTLWLGVAAGPSRLHAQEGLAPDTFQDGATRTLVERAIAARKPSALGITSYEATLRQRMYVGVTANGFRRERGLFQHERVARVRWSDDNQVAIQWIGARTAVPIAGMDSADPDAAGAGLDGDEDADDDDDLGVTADRYLDETDFPGFDFGPGADRLRFGDDWAFHPLADSALAHYRYSLGDTLRLRLPASGEAVVLHEVRVEPRRADFELLAASLWLDSASASLVRATYRPARPWSLRLDDPETAADVPGFVGPIEAEIRYVTVENGMQDLRYWLPRRFAFQGEARVGGLFRVPVTLEWSASRYVVNEAPDEVLVDGALPDGWQRQANVESDEDGDETRYTVIVPTSEELRRSPELSDDFGIRRPVSFSADEVAGLARELQDLIPTHRRFPPRIAWGLQQGQLRYNRVEGLSLGAATAVTLASRLHLDVAGRFGTGDRSPNGSLGLRWGGDDREWVLEGYHRLASMNEVDDPFTLVNSLKNVAAGGDRGEYYRTSGASLGHQRRGQNVRSSWHGFVERHRAVQMTTDFSLRGLVDDLVEGGVLQADEVDVAGLSALVRGFAGTDPSGWVFTGDIGGEIAVGDVGYRRVDARVSAGHPLALGLAGAVEVAAGTSWGVLPVQRSFFLGGSRTLRGFSVNEHRGRAYWRARGELATAFAGARLALFSGLGWAGERSAFRLEDPLAVVGAGASLLDGVVRVDVARAVRGSDGWKIHLYLDGLL